MALSLMRQSAIIMLFISLALCLVGLTVALPHSKAESLSVPMGAQNFTQTVSTGMWFVKHYSPKCKHCKKMAPFWVELSHKYAETKDFHLGEINCLVEADLCERHDITGFPTMIMYNNGDRGDEFEEEPTVESMSLFVEQQLLKHAAEKKVKTPPIPQANPVKNTTDTTTTPAPSANEADKKATKQSDKNQTSSHDAIVNPDGHEVALSSVTFNELVNSHSGPWFIKFFAPWCGHCQHLAPTWKELGHTLKGKVNVGSVDCTIEADICKQFNVLGYPTLKLFVEDTTIDYRGGRSLDDLQSFAVKASVKPVTEISMNDWTEVTIQHDIFYIMSGVSADDQANTIYGSLARSLFSLSTYYRTSDTALARQLKLPEKPVFAVYKDEQVFTYTGSLTDKTAMQEFIERHRYPALIPIDINNSQDMLGDDGENWVVLGLLAPKRVGFDRSKADLKSAALEFKRQLASSALHSGDDVDDARVSSSDVVRFAWLDATNYVSYVSGAFGIQDAALPTYVIIHRKDSEYYDKDVNGQSFRFAKNDILANLEAARNHKLHGKSMLGFVAGAIKGGVKKLSHVGSAAVNNPILAFIGILAVFGVLAFMVKRSTGDSNYTRIDPKAD
ncbi:thioredoxin-like protein [Syncephalis plumigaleata]|nr:thioredoxin-like protein [Syncephalis plumigaleata]